MGKKLGYENNDNFEDFFGREQEDMSKQLPREYTDSYNILSLISETTLHKSYLLEDKKQHFKLLLKTGTGEALTLLSTEAKMGERVVEALGNEKGRVISYKEIDGTGYLLRHYIEGMNLKEYSERRVVLTAEEIYDVMHILCHKISILHKLNPPVIHRDIKPENIIIYAKEGHVIDVHLIDFGTARSFDEKKQHDTMFVGTRQTAAPEQYGFSQTNERTDIYGLGKVLCYMLSGGFEVEGLRAAGRGLLYHMHLSMAEYRNLCQVVEKSTELDPAKRFQSVDQFENACFRVNMFQKYGHIIANALVACVLVGIAFIIGYGAGGSKTDSKGIRNDNMNQYLNENSETEAYDNIEHDDGGEAAKAVVNKDNSSDYAENDNDTDTDTESDKEISSGKTDINTGLSLKSNGEVDFGSELLYEAAKKTLPEDTLITPDELAKIRSIRIVSNRTFGFEYEIWGYGTSVFAKTLSDEQMQFDSSNLGDISDLSAVAYMDNLEELYLGNQMIEDISALRGCKAKTLLLNGNNIKDFSVLSTMPNLEILYIGNNPISDLSFLKDCKKLRMLNIDSIVVNDIKALEDTNIGEIELHEIRVFDNDYTVLERMDSLYRLGVSRAESGMINVLGELDNITMLSIDVWPDEDLERISGLTNLSSLGISSDRLVSMKGIEKMTNIQRLYFDNNLNLADVSGIDKLDRLQEFVCNSSMIKDVTPLCNLSPNITRLVLYKSVAAEVIKRKPEYEDFITLEE